MANFMQASVFLPQLQYFKYLKPIFLNLYNCTSKLGFLTSSHIFKCVSFTEVLVEDIIKYVST